MENRSSHAYECFIYTYRKGISYLKKLRERRVGLSKLKNAEAIKYETYTLLKSSSSNYRSVRKGRRREATGCIKSTAGSNYSGFVTLKIRCWWGVKFSGRVKLVYPLVRSAFDFENTFRDVIEFSIPV